MGASGGIVVDPFGQNVTGSGQDGGCRLDTRLFGIDIDGITDERCGEGLGIGSRILRPEGFGEGFESELFCDGGAGALAWFEGKVDILQGVERCGGFDLGAEFLGEELALFQ